MHRLVGLAALFFLTLSAFAQSTAAPWKYDLKPGDHLVYRYSFERTVAGFSTQSQSRRTYTSHVLVVGGEPDRLSVGFQRNRQSAELTMYRENGNDALAAHLPVFQKEVAERPARFAEANEINQMGKALGPWQATREEESQMLVAIHEIEALPTQVVQLGDSWRGLNVLGFDFRFASLEDLAGKTCDRVEGNGPGGTKHLNFLWCPDIGAIGKLDFNGDYTLPTGENVHEHITFELQQRLRNESVDDWLKSEETQQGVLQALQFSKWIPLTPDQLLPALQSADHEAVALALATLYQRRMPAPSRELVSKLAASPDQEVRRLAREVLEPEKAAATSAGATSYCGGFPQPEYPSQKPGTSLRNLHTGSDAGYPYMLHIPKDYRGDRPFPLLVYLSGGSGMAIDAVNESARAVGPSEYVVLFPQAGDLWWNEEVPRTFAPVLREVLEDLNIDKNRVYITGYSNGATGALYYATLWPQRFAALVSLMGAGQCVAGIGAGLPNIDHIPALFVHGDQDRRIPLKCSQDTYDALAKLSPDTAPKFDILKDRIHDINLETDGGRTFDFLKGKLRNPYPRKLSLRIVDTEEPRRYWIEVLSKGGPVAQVDAEIKSDNTLEITTREVHRLRLLLRPELFPSPGPVRILLNQKEAFHGELKKDCATLESSSRAWADPALGYTDLMEFDVAP